MAATLKVNDLRIQRQGGDVRLINDMSHLMLGLIFGPTPFIIIPIFWFMLEGVDSLIKVAAIAAFLAMEYIGFRVIKANRPTLCLPGMRRQVEFYRNTNLNTQEKAILVEGIEKIQVHQLESQGAELFSFKLVLKGQSASEQENRFSISIPNRTPIKRRKS